MRAAARCFNFSRRRISVPSYTVGKDFDSDNPSQMAVLSKPYRTTGKNGELLFAPAEFAKIAVAADKQGLLVHVHANIRPGRFWMPAA